MTFALLISEPGEKTSDAKREGVIQRAKACASFVLPEPARPVRIKKRFELHEAVSRSSASLFVAKYESAQSSTNLSIKPTIVVEADAKGMTVQFEDRADTSWFAFSNRAWLEFIEVVNCAEGKILILSNWPLVFPMERGSGDRQNEQSGQDKIGALKIFIQELLWKSDPPSKSQKSC